MSTVLAHIISVTVKNWDTNNMSEYVEQFRFTMQCIQLPKDADGMANSVDPDQTAPIKHSELDLHCCSDKCVPKT